MKKKSFKRGSIEDPLESKRQKAIVEKLRLLAWFVKVIPGNAALSGMPDLYACHIKYQARWIEVKREKHTFTKAQWKTFPEMMKRGIGIWILQDASDEEFAKLHGPPNCLQFMMNKL